MRPRTSRRSSQPETSSGFRVPGLAWWALGGGGIVAIIVLVAVLQGTSNGANVGEHWHAALNIQTCGDDPYSIPPFDDEIHSHPGDDLIHIHPQSAGQAGSNASLDRYFRNVTESVAGFSISEDHIEIDGTEYRNGDLCNDGNPGQLLVTINGERMDDFLDYLPQDGDSVDIRFQ